MRNMGVVQGSVAQAKPLIIGKDTVYVHTDIKPMPPDEFSNNAETFQYNEVQYGRDEYLELQYLDMYYKVTLKELGL